MGTITLPGIHTPGIAHGGARPRIWAAYVRVSTWKEEKISPELQMEAIRKWVARNGGILLDPPIVDLDATGRNFKRKIQRAIELVESGAVHGVIVWRYSRFGRNRTGNAVALARVEDAGGELVSATEPFDAHTAVGEFQREMMFAFGNFESNRAGEQWKEAHEYRVERLKLPPTGGKRWGYDWTRRYVPDLDSPTGYRLQAEGYAVNPDTGPVAEELYERKVAELDFSGFNSLVHWLNDELALPTTRGNQWGVSTLSRYMDSGWAAGLLRIHDTGCRCGQPAIRKKCPHNRYLYVPGAQPAVITPDTWKMYQEHRRETAARAPRARRATYATTGLVAHGACRAHLSAASDTSATGEQLRGRWLVCGKHKHKSKKACDGISVEREWVEQELRQWLADGPAADVDAAPAADPEVEQRARVAVDRDVVRTRVRDQLGRAERGLATLVKSAALDPELYPPEAFVAARDELIGERDRARARLAELEEAEALPGVATLRPVAVGLLAEWDTLMPAARNAILRRLVRRVVVDGQRHAHTRYGWAWQRAEVHPAWEPDPWAPAAVGDVAVVAARPNG